MASDEAPEDRRNLFIGNRIPHRASTFSSDARLCERKTANALHAIKVCIERSNPFDAPIQHHRCMHGITRGKALLGHEIACAVRISKRNGMDDRTKGREEIVNVTRHVELVQCRITMENLLKDLSARAGFDFVFTDGFKEAQRRLAVGMITSRAVHRDVRVDENDHRRPAAISASICSISAVGAFSEASLASGSKVSSVSIETRTFARSLTPFSGSTRRRVFSAASYSATNARDMGAIVARRLVPASSLRPAPPPKPPATCRRSSSDSCCERSRRR